MRECKEDGCGGKYYALGWCGRHYNRFARHRRGKRPYEPQPRFPIFRNPLVPQVEEMALKLGPSQIARLLGVTKNMVIGIIWRARLGGRLIPNHVPTPNRFPPVGCCLFMEGDPSDPAATFCGAPGDPWCSEHRKIVYRPPLDLSILDLEQTRVLAMPEAAD